MESIIKFHCDDDRNFRRPGELVRAFLYTDYSIAPHTHGFYEINIILSGQGTHHISNAAFRVKAGDVFVIPPMTVHAYDETEALDVFHILLRQKFVSDGREEAISVPGFLQLTEIEPFLRSNYSGPRFLHLSRSQLLQLQQELKFITEGGIYAQLELLPMKHHATWKILYWFSYLLSLQLQSGEVMKNTSHEKAILQVLEYIHQTYGEKITIESLCTRAYLSRSTFLRAFQEICGCTPTHYLQEYRCKKATELLEENKLSKTEIAELCGFYDLSHMMRALKGT